MSPKITLLRDHDQFMLLTLPDLLVGEDYLPVYPFEVHLRLVAVIGAHKVPRVTCGKYGKGVINIAIIY